MMFESGQRFGSSNNGIVGKQNEMESFYSKLFSYIWNDMQSDPFNRSHLTADMLIPNTELKARIEGFIKSQERKKGESLSMESAKVTIQTTNSEMLIDWNICIVSWT